jgi:hypothetical protein
MTKQKPNRISVKNHEKIGSALSDSYAFLVHLQELCGNTYPLTHRAYKASATAVSAIKKLRCILEGQAHKDAEAEGYFLRKIEKQNKDDSKVDPGSTGEQLFRMYYPQGILSKTPFDKIQ